MESHMAKNKVYLEPYAWIKSKWVRVLMVKNGTIKVWEEITGQLDHNFKLESLSKCDTFDFHLPTPPKSLLWQEHLAWFLRLHSNIGIHHWQGGGGLHSEFQAHLPKVLFSPQWYWPFMSWLPLIFILQPSDTAKNSRLPLSSENVCTMPGTRRFWGAGGRKQWMKVGLTSIHFPSL